MGALHMGEEWTSSEDFMRYPTDPPLSDAGMDAARHDIAIKVLAFAQENDTQIHNVVTSPYLRCVQTAVEVCKALGPSTRLIIDHSLGEVFGPDILGEVQPISPVRPTQALMNYCAEQGVRCVGKAIGAWPQWPENLVSARRRYMSRFLTLMQRGAVSKRNFLVVSHADCVGAAVSVMPSQVGKVVEKVQYGGMFLATRQGRGAGPATTGVARKPSLLPTAAAAQTHAAAGSASGDMLDGALMVDGDQPGTFEVDPREEDAAPPGFVGLLPLQPSLPLEPHKSGRGNVGCNAIEPPRPLAIGAAWVLDVPDEEGFGSPQAASRRPKPPVSSIAGDWQVITHSLMVRGRPVKDASASLGKKLSLLVRDTRMTQQRIEALLGEMCARPLGDAEWELPTPQAPFQGPPSRAASSVSLSTYLFGAGGSEFDGMVDMADDAFHSESSLASAESAPEAALKRKQAKPRTSRRTSTDGKASAIPEDQVLQELERGSRLSVCSAPLPLSESPKKRLSQKRGSHTSQGSVMLKADAPRTFAILEDSEVMSGVTNAVLEADELLAVTPPPRLVASGSATRKGPAAHRSLPAAPQGLGAPAPASAAPEPAAVQAKPPPTLKPLSGTENALLLRRRSKGVNTVAAAGFVVGASAAPPPSEEVAAAA